jgi:hypothetical protein
MGHSIVAKVASAPWHRRIRTVAIRSLGARIERCRGRPLLVVTVVDLHVLLDEEQCFLYQVR